MKAHWMGLSNWGWSANASGSIDDDYCVYCVDDADGGGDGGGCGDDARGQTCVELLFPQ